MGDFDYPLEKDKEDVIQAGGFNYPNSQGFRYEAEAVTRCILQGKKECPQFLPSETLILANIMDEIRKQLGVRECKQAFDRLSSFLLSQRLKRTYGTNSFMSV